MRRHILMRFFQAVVSLLALSVIVFVLVRLTGDPRDILLGDDYTQVQWDALGELWGLDKPVPVQYGVFIKNSLTGNFGDSLFYSEPAIDMLVRRIPATLQLTASALSLGVLVAVPMGVLSAVKRNTWVDTIGKSIAMLGQSIPAFWLGILLVWVFAVTLGLLPTSGREGPLNLVLPTVTLGWFVVAGIMRITRSAMLDVLDSEYIKLARVKGVPEPAVIWRHALRNAAIPVVTFVGIILGNFLTGFVVVETIFAWPGIGLLAINAIQRNDFAVVQTIVLFGGVVFITINFLVDILYGYLDPRIRFE